MKTKLLKPSLVACAVIFAVNANADTFKISSSDTFTHTKSDDTTITQKVTNKTFKPSYGAQNARYAGSAGFFDVMGAEEALQIVTGNHQNTPGWYATAVNLGATDDATNLDNMKEAFKLIKRSNELRAEEARIENKDIPTLKISHAAMAMSQIAIDKASSLHNHPDLKRTVDGAYYAGENLGWGYSATSVVDGWYSEKICHSAPNSAECLAIPNKSENKTGHYDSLVNPEFTVTGAAVARGTEGYTTGQEYYGVYEPVEWDWKPCEDKPGHLCADSFTSYSTEPENIPVYSLADYEAMFDSWRNGEEHYKDTIVILERPNQKNDEFTWIAGGASATNGIVVENNTLKITANEEVREAFGGYHLANGNTINNTIEVKDGASIYLLAGGQAQKGNANSNKVSVTKATLTEVLGGKSANGSANNNAVTIEGGSVNKGIIAGQGTNATNNKVEISDNTIVSGIYIIGSESTSGEATGELNLIYVTANDADIIGAKSNS